MSHVIEQKLFDPNTYNETDNITKILKKQVLSKEIILKDILNLPCVLKKGVEILYLSNSESVLIGEGYSKGYFIKGY